MNLSAPQKIELRCGNKSFLVGARTYVMGVLNVTPDSLSDGGDFTRLDDALKHAEQMCEDGVDIIDIGGESTRPFANAVSPEEELARVLPLVRELVGRGIRCLSIDTRHASTAKACLEEGVSWLNDVTALAHDKQMAQLAAQFDGVVLMHMRGEPTTMQIEVAYSDVVRQVHEYFLERVKFAMQHGVHRRNIIVDPGIGFGKRLPHNLALIKALAKFQDIAGAVLCGPSRKAFLGELTGIKEAKLRDNATIAAITMAVSAGADIVRVHNVKATVQALKVVDAFVRGP